MDPTDNSIPEYITGFLHLSFKEQAVNLQIRNVREHTYRSEGPLLTNVILQSY